MHIDVVLHPAEIATVLPARNLSATTCVVFDVLRATSSMITALAHGATEIYPVRTIEEAMALKARMSGALLGGERNGDLIEGFDVGNSPLEYTERVNGRRIVTTTTNGTIALRACDGAERVLVGAMLNIDAVAKVLSLAESAAAEARAIKKSEALMISATVYDRQVTELRWRSGNRDYHAWSNIDFNYLAGQGEIETEDCVYFLIMGLGNETRESVAEWNRFSPEWERLAAAKGLAGQWATKAVPDLAKFPAERSAYLLSGEAPADASLAALDALHRYFDANRLRLIADFAKREEERTARELRNREHPPTPQDTVINFWPKKSRNYPTGK